MSTETWSEDAGPAPQGASEALPSPSLRPTPQPPTPAGAPSRRAGPLARSTVLPRLELQGDASVVVRERQPRYDGIRELGRGGLGVVLGARDRDIGRRVAIKQLRDDRQSPKALLRFAEEVRTVGKLDHPYIVPIHDVGTDADGQPYFVMKYVEGQTMASVIEAIRAGDPATTEHWTLGRRVEVFRKVLEAVGFAHDQGIVHRDLKPENIMIGSHGEVHVLDWGIAHRDTSPDLSGVEGDDPLDARVTQTRDGAVMGTPHYMAPEQARGRPVDARTDVYALGVVLHEWLSGHHYLEDVPDVEAVLDAVRERPFPNVYVQNAQGVPPDLGWIVLGATAKDPADRYASVAAWLVRFDERDEGEIHVQCPFTFQKRMLYGADSAIDRHPFLWTAALTGLGAVGLAAALFAVSAAFVVGALLF